MKKTLMFVLMVIGVVLLISGCASDPQRGITDDTIKIGSWGPQTGPAALWGSVPRGTKAYFDMINEEGGIHGRKIEYHMRDDGYQPPKTKAAVKELVEMEGVFACVGGVGTATGMAVRDYLAENNVPWVGPTSGSTHWAYPTSETCFGVYPLYCHEAAVMVDYAVNEMGKKKIAFFYQNDDYGKLGLYGAEAALANHGLELVASVSAEMMDTDLVSHAMKLKESGADIVIMWVLPKHAAIMLGTSAKLGFGPQWMTSSTLSDMAVMYKITKGLWKDVIFANFAELPTSDHPLMVKYREAQKKFAPEDRFGVFFYAGMLFAEPMIEALKRAGKDLTAESFVKAMESIEEFQGIGPQISFGPDKRQGSESIFLSKCVNAMEAEQLTDWVTSDLDIDKIVAKF